MSDLSRYDEIQRLNKHQPGQAVEDAGHADSIAATCFMICVAIALLCAVMAYIKRPVAMAVVASPVCDHCHYPAPALGTYKKYRRYWHAPAADQKRLLAELVRP